MLGTEIKGFGPAHALDRPRKPKGSIPTIAYVALALGAMTILFHYTAWPGLCAHYGI